MRLRRLLPLLLVFLSVLVPVTARAATPALGVDQIISVLAEVISDRATQVASRTMQRNVVKPLCGESKTADGPKLKLTWGTAADPKTELTLGGTSKCKSSSSECRANDVFVNTCRRVLRDSVSLTDPAFLKGLTRDSVAFVLRLATVRLSEERFESLKLDAFATFVFQAMDAIAKDGADLDALVRALDALASDLSPTVSDAIIAQVASSPLTKTALLNIGKTFRDTCKNAKNNPACDLYNAAPAAYFSEDLFDPSKRAAACESFFAKHAGRRAANATAYGAKGALSEFGESTKKCPDTANRPCLNGQAMFSWAQALEKAVCADFSGDARRDYRNLLYVLNERERYADAKEQLSALFQIVASQESSERLRRLTEIAKTELPKPGETVSTLFAALPPEIKSSLTDLGPSTELGDAFRVFSAALAALRDDPHALQDWSFAFEAALQSVKLDEDGLTKLLRHPVLDAAARPTSPTVARFRDAVKDLISAPRFTILAQVREIAKGKTTDDVRKALLAILADIAQIGRQKETARTLLAHLNVVFGQFARVFDGIEAAPGADASLAETMSASLSLTADVIVLASDRDWVGVSLRASDELAKLNTGHKLDTTLGFVHVLMSTYQASTPEEAKAIMKTALQDIDSRETRFDGFTIDLGALVAGQGGYQWNTYRPKTPSAERLDDAPVAGVYAPVGFQLAYSHFGALLYPIDVGAYLVANTAKGGAAPDASAALRFGGALFFRPCKSVPIDIGAGADMHPRFEDRAELRVLGFVALELPLITLR